MIIPPQTSQSAGLIKRWLLISALVFTSYFVVALLLVTLLNGGWVNYLLTPVGSYFSMFQLIWPEQPLGALQFIVTKSFIVFAHKDPRSELNLWTLEYDAITLGVYLLTALLAGWLINKQWLNKRNPSALIPVFSGLLLVVISFSYMTVLDHCSGATWVGFVTLYGLGFDGFELYPYYQIVFALIGLGLLVWGMLLRRKS